MQRTARILQSHDKALGFGARFGHIIHLGIPLGYSTLFIVYTKMVTGYLLAAARFLIAVIHLNQLRVRNRNKDIPPADVGSLFFINGEILFQYAGAGHRQRRLHAGRRFDGADLTLPPPRLLAHAAPQAYRQITIHGNLLEHHRLL